MFVDESMSLV